MLCKLEVGSSSDAASRYYQVSFYALFWLGLLQVARRRAGRVLRCVEEGLGLLAQSDTLCRSRLVASTPYTCEKESDRIWSLCEVGSCFISFRAWERHWSGALFFSAFLIPAVLLFFQLPCFLCSEKRRSVFHLDQLKESQCERANERNQEICPDLRLTALHHFLRVETPHGIKFNYSWELVQADGNQPILVLFDYYKHSKPLSQFWTNFHPSLLEGDPLASSSSLFFLPSVTLLYDQEDWTA